MNHQHARSFLIDEIERFLVGPAGGPKETILAGNIYCDGDSKPDQTVNEFYHTGFLSPSFTSIDLEEDDQDDQGHDIDGGKGEGIMQLANASLQSAIGFTCQVEDPSLQIQVHAEWGSYVLEEERNNESVDDNAEQVANKNIDYEHDAEFVYDDMSGRKKCGQYYWKRKHEVIEKIFSITDDHKQSILIDNVEISINIRLIRGIYYITTTLINRKKMPEGKEYRLTDPRMYQAKLSIHTKEYNKVFVGGVNTARRKDDDFWQQELMYRNIKQFAVGHGCSVEWESDGAENASVINTVWIPRCEVYKASADVIDDDYFLELDYLSAFESDTESMLNSLHNLVVLYRAWIKDQAARSDEIISTYNKGSANNIKNTIDETISLCEIQCERIKSGIDFLSNNRIALESFMLANKAMAQAMSKSRDMKPKWYPFQLAFFLISIPSVSDRSNEDRRILDLIWFPTGGGKTEAYLGISAFTLFYRYLNSSSKEASSGTSIITRYTLRTLTIQQFERTTMAIMACEIVRRNHSRLKRYMPFSIGLLVGSGATPKWIDRPNIQDSAVELLKHGGKPAEGSLLPLKKCPWCNTRLSLSEITIHGKKLLTKCANNECDFAESIPICIVDEHIYNEPPSFIVATIDKFAQLAWEPKLAHILGKNTPGLPPDLIIQDELHLINDSLGTVAGVYETAIDALSEYEGIGPKIIGATATIRNADIQVKSLFLKETRQFPPSGLDADDSFFYCEDIESPGRLYVGIHAQGRSPKHTLPRIIATILQAANEIEPVDVKDNYWTLVSYFNSLRELGGALVIAEDDVPAYQKILASYKNNNVRKLLVPVEMTGQVPHHRIPEILDQLDTGIVNPNPNYEPIDLLLATSMISVGVDVDRLGVMVVAGQPKTTAEYIQATSRVGRPRGSAGLVITLYNWTRPRDRSYYERFMAYHNSFYRFVEAVSVTPFTRQAREKTLEGVLATMIRSVVPGQESNLIDNPERLANKLGALLSPIKAIILNRVKSIDPREVKDTGELIDLLFENFEDFLRDYPDKTKYWIRWGVSKKEQKNSKFLMQSGIDHHDNESPWEAMLSMRDTDTPTPLCLKENSAQLWNNKGV